MEFGIFCGALVDVREEHEDSISIINGDSPEVVKKDEIVLLRDGVLGELAKDLHETKTEINNLMGRMYRLDEEYHKKIEALREMYMAARSKEISITNKILRKSHEICQK